jgi:glycosyltransferase involved in cell wall biosynthesis
MPRFARMLEEAYLLRGHEVKVWSPQPVAYQLLPSGRFSKWAGYLDQYILFPLWVRRQLKKQPSDTLYVFCDQALGPWVPLVKNKPHIVHVHDLLALRSALGDVPENPTSWSGRIYQHYIRQGFKQAKHFISISNKTRDDLHHFGQVSAMSSHVVYNGFNYPYAPMAKADAMRVLNEAGLPAQSKGMLLQVGSSTWYKNLAGVIRIYLEYVKSEKTPLPLWCISPSPSLQVQALLKQLPSNGKVLFFQGIDNYVLQAAYSLARACVFPSLAEGFGWPIIEAQACGCPVLTSDAAPMNEVGGPHSIYLPVLKYHDDQSLWAKKCCKKLSKFLNLDAVEISKLSSRGRDWVKRFNADSALEEYLNIYRAVLKTSNEIE